MEKTFVVPFSLRVQLFSLGLGLNSCSGVFYCKIKHWLGVIGKPITSFFCCNSRYGVVIFSFTHQMGIEKEKLSSFPPFDLINSQR